MIAELQASKLTGDALRSERKLDGLVRFQGMSV
jgi:hypothetical protein